MSGRRLLGHGGAYGKRMPARDFKVAWLSCSASFLWWNARWHSLSSGIWVPDAVPSARERQWYGLLKLVSWNVSTRSPEGDCRAVEPHLKKLMQRTLLITSDGDWLLPSREEGPRLQKLLPRVQLKVWPCWAGMQFSDLFGPVPWPSLGYPDV